MTAIALPRTRARDSTIRRELGIFFTITAALTGALIAIAVGEDVDLRHLDDATALGQTALFAQAFVPGLAALIARAATTGGIRGLGWRPTRRYALVCYLAPIAAVLPAYALGWLLDTNAFDENGAVGEAIAGVTLGVIPFLVLALGEEIGWRGLLVARLAEITSLPWITLITGLSWTAFHVPLMVLIPGAVDGVPMSYGIAVFALGLIALSYPLAWLRLRTGSVWPPALFHAAGNAAIYLFADPLTTDDASPWLLGETGVLLLAGSVILAIAWWRRA